MSKDQLKAMKEQLEEYKKLLKSEHQDTTPAKAQQNRDLSDRVSDSFSNGKSHKNMP